MRRIAARLAGLLVAVGTAATPAVAGTLAVTGARVLPVAGPAIENGVLLIADGRIVAVGAADEVIVPADAEIRDLTGRVVIPGIVDTHSHIADVSGGDRSGPMHPEVRALDGVDIRADSIRKARAGGITTVNVMPGSGYRMSGQTAYLKLRASGTRVEEWLICPDAAGGICGGMKMANGTNSLRDVGGFPRTRGRSAAIVRARFAQAVEYREKLAEAGDDPEKAPKRSLGDEALIELLEGRRIVHHHTHRADDIATALRLADELGLRIALHHVSDGWVIPDLIAAAPGSLGCSINVMDSPGGKHENSARRLETPGILDRAGVPVAISTDDAVTDSRFLLRSAALAVRGGLSVERALEALTVIPARMLDLAERIGSLEPGKDADFVVLSGPPFSVWTHVEETWVEGERVFDRSGPTRDYQTGGWQVYRGDESGDAHGFCDG